MYLKANYNDIENVSNKVMNETVKLEETFKEMEDLVESIRSCWTGPDAENFINNSSTFIKNCNQEVTDLKNICDFTKKVSDAYRGKDIAWGEKIKSVGDEYEK